MQPVERRPRGLFVTLEGGEGAGKGSALNALRDALARAGHDVLVTREPGGSPACEAIRSLIVERAHDWTPRSELLLLMADRAEHVERLIRPALAAGRTVLCDRFDASTYAYQGAGKGLDASAIACLQAIAAQDAIPDLTVLLDVDPQIGLARSMRRLTSAGSTEDRFETLGVEFHARVRESFLAQARAAPDRWIVIDASAPLQTVAQHAVESLLKRLRALKPAGG